METDNKSLVKDYINIVLNEGDISLIPEFIAADYSEVFNGKKYAVGIEGAKEHITGVRSNYPDIKLTINQQIAEGDWVATCYTMNGTHTGSWMGIKPSGKKLFVTGVNIDKIVGGKIVEHGGAANMFEGLLDIGAIRIVT
jgi:predicted ester cyclase